MTTTVTRCVSTRHALLDSPLGRDLRRLLHAIPCGTTTTYSALAADLERSVADPDATLW